MKRIAVLTSGGDSPGMNAAIRAVVRTGIFRGVEIIGIQRGFAGLINNEIIPLDRRSVGNIIHVGGTILRTSRCEEFKTQEGQRKAAEVIKKNAIDGLIVIGGAGSFRGAHEFNTDWKIPTIGIPSTIDNDIGGTDYCIGFDTAVNTVLDAINKIRDTATSHERLFFIEVMGRDTGFIALEAGVAGGAEVILIPEVPFDNDSLCDKVISGYRRGKLHSIVIVAEGVGSAYKIGAMVAEKTGFECRIVVLGHLQRGGTPTLLDRMLASRLGYAAVELLLKGEQGKMVGVAGNKIQACGLESAWKYKKEIDMDLYRLAEILAL